MNFCNLQWRRCCSPFAMSASSAVSKHAVSKHICFPWKQQMFLGCSLPRHRAVWLSVWASLSVPRGFMCRRPELRRRHMPRTSPVPMLMSCACMHIVTMMHHSYFKALWLSWRHSCIASKLAGLFTKHGPPQRFCFLAACSSGAWLPQRATKGRRLFTQQQLLFGCVGPGLRSAAHVSPRVRMRRGFYIQLGFSTPWNARVLVYTTMPCAFLQLTGL